MRRFLAVAGLVVLAAACSRHRAAGPDGPELAGRPFQQVDPASVHRLVCPGFTITQNKVTARPDGNRESLGGGNFVQFLPGAVTTDTDFTVARGDSGAGENKQYVEIRFTTANGGGYTFNAPVIVTFNLNGCGAPTAVSYYGLEYVALTNTYFRMPSMDVSRGQTRFVSMMSDHFSDFVVATF